MIMSTEDNIQTPKSSQSSYSYNNSPLPKNIIKLGDLASKYLPKIKDKCFGLYYDEEWNDHYIGKNPLKFENNDIILNGKTYKGTPESIYQNNDKSNRNPKSSGSNKYKMMIKPMYNEIKETTNKTKGGGLKKYTDDHIEYCYINNMKQLTDRLQLIAVEERAGNNNYHNEKLGILQLCKTSLEKIIDTPK
ncbi:Parvo coat N domain-containing protein, partial [Aphis craccivora]